MTMTCRLRTIALQSHCSFLLLKQNIVTSLGASFSHTHLLYTKSCQFCLKNTTGEAYVLPASILFLTSMIAIPSIPPTFLLLCYKLSLSVRCKGQNDPYKNQNSVCHSIPGHLLLFYLKQKPRLSSNPMQTSVWLLPSASIRLPFSDALQQESHPASPSGVSLWINTTLIRHGFSHHPV